MILVDTREQKQIYICDVLNKHDVDTCITCLTHGVDYMIVGTHGSVSVQRKTFPEICNQMAEIRTDIIPHLMNSIAEDESASAALLVEEGFAVDATGMMYRKENNFLKPTSVSARMYYNFLNSIRMMGCEVVCTRNLDQSIWWMYSTHSYIHTDHYPKQKKKYGSDMQALGMLCCINSFGITVARNILEKYTIAQLLSMKDADLSKILTTNQMYNFKKAMNTTVEPDPKKKGAKRAADLKV